MKKDNPAKPYTVVRLSGKLKIDAEWNKPQWQTVEPMTLNCYMGERPEHFPHTQAKMMYDDENIYVIFKVDDQYVKAVGQGHQAMVCRDSCVEFFFTPGKDIAEGYFNLETSCGGTILLYHQKARKAGNILLTNEDLDQIEIAHSLPALITDEIAEPTTWTLEYRLPVSILEKYAPVAKPQSGTIWKANFYKCADKTSHPHWLTWSYVDLPAPDFHRPEFFGELIFK